MSLPVSVIIPTCGRPACLERCLAALARQTLRGAGFEVIVCVDGVESDVEPLARILAEAARSLSLRTVAQPRAGPAAARNRAADIARGTLLAFTDDDCAPEPDWLARLLARHEREPDALLGGAIANALPASSYAAATHLVTSYTLEYATHHAMVLRGFTTSNLALPARRFHALGGFSREFQRAAGEDYDLCARWQHNRWPMAYVREALVWHAHHHDWRSFCRQHFEYGRALLKVRRRAARRGGHALRVERPAFYAGLLAAPFRARGVSRRWRLAALVLLAEIATVAGGVCELPRATSRSEAAGIELPAAS